MLVKLKQKSNNGIKNFSQPRSQVLSPLGENPVNEVEFFADAKSSQLRKFVLSIVRPCNPSFNDLFVLAVVFVLF